MPPTRKKASRKYRVKAARAPERRATNVFPFLRLPADLRLRNRIYEYALTTPEGIKMIWHMGRSRRHKKPTACIHSTSATPDVAINQLQYVNKQIREEAAGLEIQYNSVHFEYTPRKTMGRPIANFLRFCGSIAPSRLEWLTHVVIDGLWYREPPSPIFINFGDWMEDFGREISRLLRQAEHLPQLHIDSRVPAFKLTEDLSEFVLTGLRLSHIARGTEDLTIAGQHVPIRAMIGPLDPYLRKKDIQDLRMLTFEAPQLRFLPHNTNTGKARLERILRDTPADSLGALLTPTSIGMMLHAQGWFSQGV